MSQHTDNIIEEYYRRKDPLNQQVLDLFEAPTTEFRDVQPPKMPHLPQEEEAGSNLTDQVAKESSDSTASTHKLHQEAHQANLGPVKADSLPEPESKENLKKRAEELNK